MTNQRPGEHQRRELPDGLFRLEDDDGHVLFIRLCEMPTAGLSPEELAHAGTLDDAFLSQLPGFTLAGAQSPGDVEPITGPSRESTSVVPLGKGTATASLGVPLRAGSSNPYPDGEPRWLVLPPHDLPTTLPWDTREERGIRNSGDVLMIERSG